MEWYEPVDVDEVSDIAIGPPANARVDTMPNQKSEKELDEASTRTPIDLEMDWSFKESTTKRRQEQGDANETTPMVES